MEMSLKAAGKAVSPFGLCHLPEQLVSGTGAKGVYHVCLVTRVGLNVQNQGWWECMEEMSLSQCGCGRS